MAAAFAVVMGVSVGLSVEEQIKRWIPARFYYRQKIAKVTRNGEPELRFLPDLVPVGCTAIDVGANRGYYSYALAELAARVEAFEPHPELARFARQKLGAAIPVHEIALSNTSGWTTLFVPQAERGVDVHFNSSIKKVYAFDTYVEFRVPMKTLDEFAFKNVGFIKIDTEGSDMDIIEGAAKTIERDRPNMVVELLAVTHADPLACIRQIKDRFDYDAWIVLGDRMVDATDAVANLSRSKDDCNVVFTPR